MNVGEILKKKKKEVPLSVHLTPPSFSSSCQSQKHCEKLAKVVLIGSKRPIRRNREDESIQVEEDLRITELCWGGGVECQRRSCLGQVVGNQIGLLSNAFGGER